MPGCVFRLIRVATAAAVAVGALVITARHPRKMIVDADA
jgi:hypothetical protein